MFLFDGVSSVLKAVEPSTIREYQRDRLHEGSTQFTVVRRNCVNPVELVVSIVGGSEV